MSAAKKTQVTKADSKDSHIEMLKTRARDESRFRQENANQSGRKVGYIAKMLQEAQDPAKNAFVRKYDSITVAEALVAAGRGRLIDKFGSLAIVFIEADGTEKPNGDMPDFATLKQIVEDYVG